MSERPWRLSASAEEDPKIRYLAERVRNVADNIDFSDFGYERYHDIEEVISGYDDDPSSSQFYAEYFKSDFYKALEPAQKRDIAKVIDLDETAVWRFGRATDHFDGFWEDDIYRSSLRMIPADRLVLTGMLGAEILGRSARFDRFATALEPDVLRRAILVGGIAVADTNSRNFTHGVRYTGFLPKGLAYEGVVGADGAGDFRTHRLIRASNDIIDPIGRSLSVSPTIEFERARAYHSTETIILQGLLRWLVVYSGIDRKIIHDYLMEELSKVAPEGDGFNYFANYGDSDGYSEALYLESALEHEIGEDGRLANLGSLWPGTIDTIGRLYASPRGVEFREIGEEGLSKTVMTIPMDEVIPYIVTLVRNAYGRTSPGTLFAMIQTLRDGPPQRSDRYSAE